MGISSADMSLFPLSSPSGQLSNTNCAMFPALSVQANRKSRVFPETRMRRRLMLGTEAGGGEQTEEEEDDEEEDEDVEDDWNRFDKKHGHYVWKYFPKRMIRSVQDFNFLTCDSFSCFGNKKIKRQVTGKRGQRTKRVSSRSEQQEIPKFLVLILLSRNVRVCLSSLILGPPTERGGKSFFQGNTQLGKKMLVSPLNCF